MRLEFKFQRGGTLIVTTDKEAPKTSQAVKSHLPLDAKIYQARWSGKEIFIPVNLAGKPPREHQSIRASLGDVI